MVFNRSLSDSKSPQVSGTLLSILVDLNCTVDLFLNLPVPLSILCGLFQAHHTKLVSPSSLCFIVFFSSLARSRNLSRISLSLSLGSASAAKSTICWLLLLFYSLRVFLISFNRWYYLPTPPLGQDMTQDQFLSGV